MIFQNQNTVKFVIKKHRLEFAYLVENGFVNRANSFVTLVTMKCAYLVLLKNHHACQFMNGIIIEINYENFNMVYPGLIITAIIRQR